MPRTIRAALGATVALLLLSAAPVAAPTAAVAAIPGPTVAAGFDAAATDQYVGLINGLRTSQGLAPLAVHGELVAAATDWAYHLSDIDRLEHDGNLAGDVSGGWTKLGENVGMGMGVLPVWDAFLASPGHYSNLVDPQYTHVGVAVVVDGGRLYTVHRFMTLPSGPPPTSPPPPPPAPAPAPAPSPAPAPVPTPRPAPATVPSTAPPSTLPPVPQTAAPFPAVPDLVATPPEPERAAAILDALRDLTA